MNRFQKRVQKDLVSDEVLLITTKGSPMGFADSVIKDSVWEKMKPVKSNNEINAATHFINGENLGHYDQVVVGLTNRRLLFWSTNFFNMPNELIASIERSAVYSLQETKTKMAFADLITLEIISKSDEKVDFKLALMHYGKAKKMVSIFNDFAKIDSRDYSFGLQNLQYHFQ